MPRMPAEWEPHERTWMAWPCTGYALGDSDAEADSARAAWASVAHAIAAFEPVSMLATPEDAPRARAWLSPTTTHPITVVEAALDDAWMRDTGPTFVVDGPRLAGVDWVFNGWGAQEWARWDHDAGVAQRVCALSGATRIDSPLVNEGGGVHVDGRGTALLTDTVQRDPGRNPGWTREQVEAEIGRTLGVDRVIWLPRGLTRDYLEFGTRGHVDMVAAFAPDGSVLVHDQRDTDHPDHVVTAEIRDLLLGAGVTVVDVPAPRILRDDRDWVDYSYLNHYVLNGAVILGGFDDPHDAVAVDILQQVYPDREIVLVDARALFARGGGVHCITQQQPAVDGAREVSA